MTYYRLRFTLSPVLRGSDEYIKKYNILIPNEKLYWEEPMFIGNVRNTKIDFQPYLVDIELNKKSKLHDFIYPGGSVSGKLIISNKLKVLFEKNRNSGLQFFQIHVIHNAKKHHYWLLNMYELNQEYIDFKNSKIIHRKKNKNEPGTIPITINANNIDSFLKEVKEASLNNEVIYIESLKLKENFEDDFFALKYVQGGIGYFVSEKLKKEIEDAGCTGIEFQPSELSYHEWSVSGGDREKVYGKSW